MTKPFLSWTDRHHVSALVGRCLGPAGPKPPFVDSPKAEERALPVGFGGPRPTPRPGHRAGEPLQVPDFHAVSAVIEDRVEAFLSWTVDALAARAAFIADEGGLSLGNRGQVGDLAAVSTSVFHLLDEYRRELPAFEVGRVLLDMVRPNGVLHIVVVGTDLGRFGVGVLCDDALDRLSLSALENGLTTTLTE